MEFLKKYWFIITFVVAPLFTAIGFIYSLNSRIYDNPEQKVKHEIHVEQSLSPKEQWRKYLRDSIDKENAKRSRRKRDSMYRILINRMNYSDSIQLLNADQMFQIKEKLSHEDN